MADQLIMSDEYDLAEAVGLKVSGGNTEARLTLINDSAATQDDFRRVALRNKSMI